MMTARTARADQGRLLISGATGMIGGLLVDALVARGAPLVAMIRPGSEPGRLTDRPFVDLVEADFDHLTSLKRALQGVGSALLVTNSSERTEGQQKSFVEAAQTAGVWHVVKLSQLRASSASPVPASAFVAMMEQAGMPPWQAEGLAEDYAHYERGEAADVSPDVKEVTGHAASTFRTFAADHAAAYRRN